MLGRRRVRLSNILAAVRGGQKQPLTFKTIGLLASIGRRTGVAQILGVNFSGFIAWWSRPDPDAPCADDVEGSV